MSAAARRTTLVLLCALVAGATACDVDAARSRAVDPEGAFEVALVEDGALEVDGPRAAWRMDNGVSVTVQRFAASDATVRERELSSVVEAITERFALGEVDGTMTSSRCKVGEAETTCLTGTTTVGEARFVRRGFVVEMDGQFLWIEAIGPSDVRALVDQQAELFERTFVRS